MEKYVKKLNHYLYKITNNITDEYYLGVRSCDCDIEDDKYMGSSQTWTKDYIKENFDDLTKEILMKCLTRDEADIEEVLLLKKHKDSKLCINILYDKIPSWLGKKQTEEHINKRKLIGERNGMFGKHHTDETKQQMSETLKGRIVTEETREKMSKAQKGKSVSQETKDKLREAKETKKLIIDTITGEQWIIGMVTFGKQFGIAYSSMHYALTNNTLAKKRYKVEHINAAFVSDDDRKLDENGETLEVDNPVGSLGSK